MSGKLRYWFYQKKVADLKSTKLSQWWYDARLLMGDQPVSGDGPIQDLANNVCSGNLSELADMINNFFAALCENMPSLKPDNEYSQYKVDVVPDQYIIEVGCVEKQLSTLKTNKATGPDQIPTWILKDFAPIFAGPVTAIRNSSICDGHVPELWRSAFLAPPKTSPSHTG